MGKSQHREREMREAKRGTQFAQEFKPEAVRLVKGGQVPSETAKILGIPGRPGGLGHVCAGIPSAIALTTQPKN